jgi:hypothetical protein
MNDVSVTLHQKGPSSTAHRSPPRSMSYFDDFYRCRKGTAMKAARAGLLKAVFRRGRGGIQAFAFPEDGDEWFARGLPIEKSAGAP